MRDEPSRTAESVCWFRAAERMRPPPVRILDDPYARLFLRAPARAALLGARASGWLGSRAEEHVPGLGSYVVTRHRLIDDWLERALDSGAEQLVVLGAGYDTRGWRFAKQLAGRAVFELDFPSTSARKREIAERSSRQLPAARIQRVPIDFMHERIEDKLVDAGFEPGRRSFFVWEGVSMYLTREAVKTTLRSVRQLSAAQSELAMDVWFLLDDPTLAGTLHRSGPGLIHLMGEPVTFGIHCEDLGPFAERLGWQVAELVNARELGERYIRDGRSVFPAIYMARLRC